MKPQVRGCFCSPNGRGLYDVVAGHVIQETRRSEATFSPMYDGMTDETATTCRGGFGGSPIRKLELMNFRQSDRRKLHSATSGQPMRRCVPF
jgi:hypothetical protein